MFIPSQENTLSLYNGVYVHTYDKYTMVKVDRKPALLYSEKKKEDSCDL